MRRILIFVVRAYQATLSPWVGRRCHFLPTCSQYMIDAISKKGVIKGVALGIWRFLRCHPFSRGGYDPVR